MQLWLLQSLIFISPLSGYFVEFCRVTLLDYTFSYSYSIVTGYWHTWVQKKGDLDLIFKWAIGIETVGKNSTFQFTSFWSDRKYSIGTPKYRAKRFRLSRLGSDLPDFQFEKAVWLIPVSFETWYDVLFTFSNSELYFSYKITPPYESIFSCNYFRVVIYFQS